jgi:8-oxo-dGTP pyrophosphatase MutT (NUDIX family)
MNKLKTILNEILSNAPFAVFAIIKFNDTPNSYAGTTRPADRGESGRIGLPGGKVDDGETPQEALQRECNEEGWLIKDINDIGHTPFHTAYVEGKLVHWYTVNVKNNNVTKLTDYKENGRIVPILVTREQILQSGFGNNNLKI